MIWCEYNTNKLRKHHADGLSFSALADIFRVTRSAIAGKCARLNLRRPWLDYGAAGRIGGKISAEKRRLARPPKAKKVSKFNFARKERVAEPKRAKTAAVFVTPPDAPPSLNIALVDLEPRHCRWPIDSGYCGNDKRESSSYCTFHHFVAYSPRRG